MRTTTPPRLRRHLHFDALILRARQAFDKLPEPRRCPSFTLADTLMAGLALFSLKDPSLLAFQHRALDHKPPLRVSASRPSQRYPDADHPRRREPRPPRARVS